MQIRFLPDVVYVASGSATRVPFTDVIVRLCACRLQLAAIPLLDPEHVRKERLSLQKHFKHKRDHVLKRLERLGLKVAVPPQSTFYVWLNLDHLPAPLNNGLVRASPPADDSS